MPGIAGIIDFPLLMQDRSSSSFYEHAENIRRTLQRMCRSMTYSSDYNIEIKTVAGGVGGICRVYRNFGSGGIPSGRDQSQAFHAVVEGEFFPESTITMASEVEYLLQRYHEEGDRVFSSLNGLYTLALWDNPHTTLYLSVDRCSSIPLYYYSSGGVLSFAQELKALLIAGAPADLDEEGLSEYFSCGFQFNEKTIFKNVRRLRPGEVLSCKLDGIQKKRYWSATFIHSTKNIPGVLEEASETFGKVVRERLRKGGTVGIALTGGQDTRATWSVVRSEGIGWRAFSHGLGDANDVCIARQLSSRMGIEHLVFEYTPNVIRNFFNYAQMLVRRSDGQMKIDSALILPSYEYQRLFYSILMDSSISGIERRVLFRFQARNLITPLSFATTLGSLLKKSGCLQLLSRPFRETAERVFNNSLHTLTDDLMQRAKSPEDWLDLFILEQKWSNAQAPGTTVQLGYLGSRMPMFDHRWLDIVTNIPAHIRARYDIYFAIFQKYWPDLLRVPLDHDGIRVPCTPNRYRRYVPVLYHRFIQKHRLPKVFDNYHPIATLPDWLRNQLRASAEEILFDRQTLKREWWDSEALTKVWNEHQAGIANHTNALITLLTFELFTREFLDAPFDKD